MMLCRTLKTNSDAQKKLLRYVRSNETISIEKLVYKNEGILSVEYRHPYDNQNILIIACNDQNSMHFVTGATISKLIDFGADLSEPTKNDNWQAIHYAAINSNSDKLSAILNRLSVEEANSLVHCSKYVPKKFPFSPNKNVSKSYSNNALSIILKYGRRNEQFRECCELLIHKGVNVNQADSNGVTPLDLMREEKELRDVYERIISAESRETFKTELLFELIKYNHEEEFLSKSFTKQEANAMDGPSENLSSCTLLQLCCAKGLTACVEHLLNRGASPNRIISKNPTHPIMIAIKEDHEDIVNVLLSKPDILLPEDILVKIQIKYKRMQNLARIDKYMELILQHLEKFDKMKLKNYLLASDTLNRTALHYAAHYRSSDNILKLLELGAPLTKKDLFGHTALHAIDPNILEKFFDNCIDVPKDCEDMDNMLHALQNNKERFSLEINYEALTPGNEDTEVHESEFLYYLIKLKGLSYLLNHPVVSSYLAVKWKKFRFAVYLNLLLYFLAYAALLFYGFGYTYYPQVANILLLSALVLIFFRESVQLTIFRTDYIKRVDNVIDLFLIGGIIYIIAAGWVDIESIKEALNSQNLKVAFSVVFLTSTLGIFLQLGYLPFFTIKVIVLRQTSISFCKYMIFYVFPVLAFFFCFYMLRETPDDVFFTTLYDVITMYAGDPDSSYPEQFETNPIFSHIIYVFFIVLIGIILQNLLIGLAVSDLQEIQKEAQFIDKKERANYMTNLERVLFTKYHESRGRVFRSIFHKLLKTSSVFVRERVLVIQPYNNGCVFLKESPENKQYIKDQSILILLQNIIKDLTLQKDKEVETLDCLKVIHDRLERIENLLERLDVNRLLKK